VNNENISGRPLLKRHSEQAWIRESVFHNCNRGARARIQAARVPFDERRTDQRRRNRQHHPQRGQNLPLFSAFF
jgi:hypothetical protein